MVILINDSCSPQNTLSVKIQLIMFYNNFINVYYKLLLIIYLLLYFLIKY